MRINTTDGFNSEKQRQTETEIKIKNKNHCVQNHLLIRRGDKKNQ